MASVKIYRVNDKLARDYGLEWRDDVAKTYGLLWVHVEGSTYRSLANGVLSSWDSEYLDEVKDD